VEVLTAQVSALRARVAELEAENAQLRGKGGGMPSWVKANRPPREKKPRKRRLQACVRRREQPDEIQEHAVECCPDCGRRLAGGWLQSSRQVIEVTLPQVRVVEHRFVGRRCGVCGKRWLPKVNDVALGVLGKRRFGVGVQSLVTLLQVGPGAKWHIAYRLPVGMIRRLLAEIYGLQISVGEIVALTNGVAAAGEQEVVRIRNEIRGSPAACADETGWREDGINGYLWTFATPTLRYFRCRRSRAGKVAKEALGDDFAGVVVSDFYSAYNQFPGGHQRCWAHLLRDLHALKEAHAEAASVVAWAEQVAAVYARAAAFSDARPKARRQAQATFERELARLARPYRTRKGAPQRLLAQRIYRFRQELFVFVADPRVPSTNNLAERSLRPAVIARKISGGTRSAKGSETRATLMSLVGTWTAQGKHLLTSCKELLLASAPA
jgi:transposase